MSSSSRYSQVSVVVATKNSAKTLGYCLGSLEAFREKFIDEVVVVDGNSSDSTVSIARRFNATVVEQEVDKGFFAAYDLGWRVTKSEFLLFLDSDALLEQDFFPKVSTWYAESGVGLLGVPAKDKTNALLGRLVGEWWDFRYARTISEDSKTHSNLLDRLYRNFVWEGGRQPLVQGPCYLLRRECLEAISGFPKGGDDITLSRLVSANGWPVKWWGERLVLHMPRTSMRGLILKYIRYGYVGANVAKDYHGMVTRVMRLLVQLVLAPALSFRISVAYKNPLHIPLYTTLAGLANCLGLALGMLTNAEVVSNPPTG